MSAKKSRSNKKQINMLVDFMSTHNHLATGAFTGPLGAKRADSQWLILKDILKEYGPDRTVEQWKQTWKDLKKGARTENAAATRRRNTTGNAETVPTMSEVGTKVLNIIGYESSTVIGPEESLISQEIIEVSVVERDTQSNLIKLTVPTSFLDKLKNIPPAPTTCHPTPSTSHTAPPTSHPAPSRSYPKAQNKKEWSHDVFIRLQQCLQSIDERLKEHNYLLHEQNQLLHAQNAHLAHRNKITRMERFSQRFKF